ncbi:MAG: DUF411 domain-containing protein [Gemmatimonadales bacterium]
MSTPRRLILAVAAGLLVAGSALLASRTAASATDEVARLALALPLTEVTVYRSPTCGCCKKWVAHIEQAGFTVKQVELADLAEIKAQAGVPEKLHSCHTALVGRYAIEGHVPAEDIKRLLAEKPDVHGLSAPGMPAGSPGMEVEGRKDKYDVVSFTREGQSSVWASH